MFDLDPSFFSCRPFLTTASYVITNGDSISDVGCRWRLSLPLWEKRATVRLAANALGKKLLDSTSALTHFPFLRFVVFIILSQLS